MPIIEVKDLIKIYNIRDVPFPIVALNGISLSVQEGDIFGIIGMSGAGKTTLIRCLIGLEKPTSGKILLSGQDITSLSGQELRNERTQIGMVFQHFNLFSSRTALENIMFPLEVSKKGAQDRAQELLTTVGLQGKEHFYPAQLSGGEKQRVAIARALANQPKVILCDEPTSSLDPRTTHSILELLVELNKQLKITILLITHEMDVVKRICNKLAVLEKGKIVEQGNLADLFAAPKHETTKRFLQNLSHEFPEHFLTKKNDAELIRLSFRGDQSKKPIISELIKKHDIEVNILLGAIDILREGTVGNLVVEILGPLKERERARIFLKEQGVECHEFT